MRPFEVRKVGFGGFDELGVPEAEDDTRGERGLPIVLRRNGLVNETEEAFGVVLNLDVHLSKGSKGEM